MLNLNENIISHLIVLTHLASCDMFYPTLWFYSYIIYIYMLFNDSVALDVVAILCT